MANSMNNIRVSIVEDLEEIRRALQVLIHGSEGFSCDDVYSNAEEALVHLPGINPDIVKGYQSSRQKRHSPYKGI